jgi:EAL domain-containing protein (putative c-di-GMP-specific phosphodiesterase class I)
MDMDFAKPSAAPNTDPGTSAVAKTGNHETVAGFDCEDLESMLDVCRDLKIRVIAEGVETKEELDALVKLNCELFQGCPFARPAMSIP